MKVDLNLLPNVARFQANKIEAKKRIRHLSYGLAILWLLLIISGIAYWLISQVQLAAGQRKYKTAEREYLAISETIVNSWKAKYKAKTVGSIINRRFEYGQAIEKVNSLFGAEVNLEKVEMKGAKGFTIRANSETATTIDDMEEKVILINNGEIEGFGQAKISQLSWEGNQWKFSLEVVVE